MDVKEQSETWKVEETATCWTKRWLRYDKKGRAVGCTIIAQNPTTELIEAIKEGWNQTEGRFVK